MLNDTFLTSRLNDALGWARKFSIFQYPFVTACCGMEYMATACSHYDVDRFGAGLPRFSPRQADVLFVVGTISHKMAPVLKRIHDQMAEPKWVARLSKGNRPSSSGKRAKNSLACLRSWRSSRKRRGSARPLAANAFSVSRTSSSRR